MWWAERSTPDMWHFFTNSIQLGSFILSLTPDIFSFNLWQAITAACKGNWKLIQHFVSCQKVFWLSSLSSYRGVALWSHPTSRHRTIHIGKVVGGLHPHHGHVNAQLLGDHLSHLGVDPLAHLYSTMQHSNTAISLVHGDVDMVASAPIVVSILNRSQANPFLKP